MAEQKFPMYTQVQWTETARKYYPDQADKVFTVWSYNRIRGIYGLKDENENLSFSGEQFIEKHIAHPRLHLLDEVNQVVMKHSYPVVRYVDSSGYDVMAECRCGVEISDIAPDLFFHSQHISEEILRIVGK